MNNNSSLNNSIALSSFSCNLIPNDEDVTLNSQNSILSSSSTSLFSSSLSSSETSSSYSDYNNKGVKRTSGSSFVITDDELAVTPYVCNYSSQEKSLPANHTPQVTNLFSF